MKKTIKTIKEKNQEKLLDLDNVIKPQILSDNFLKKKQTEEEIKNDKEVAVRCYPKIIKLIKELGVRHDKKHGDFWIVQKENKYLALDTWNGYINIIDGVFNGCDTFHRGSLLSTYNNGNIKATRYSMGLAYKFIMFEK